MEVSKYAGGKLLYVPAASEKCSWGEKSGSGQYLQERNQKMRELFQGGMSLEKIASEFALSRETVKRIVK